MERREIRALRRRHGWTQVAFAERLGTDAVTVSRWERGVSRPRPSAQARLAQLSVAQSDVIAVTRAALSDAAAERVLRRALLLAWPPQRHRLPRAATRRLRDVDRARREQAELKARARMTP